MKIYKRLRDINLILTRGKHVFPKRLLHANLNFEKNWDFCTRLRYRVLDFNLPHVEGGGGSQMSKNSAKKKIFVIHQEGGKVVLSCSTSGSEGPWIYIFKRLMPIKIHQINKIIFRDWILPCTTNGDQKCSSIGLEMCFAPQRRATFHLSCVQMASHPPL